MRKLTVNLSNQNSYDIIIEDNLLSRLSFYIKEVYTKKEIFILTDENVADIYLEKVVKNLETDFIVNSVVIKAGEESKNLEVYTNVCEKFLEMQVRRNHLILGLGGGVIGDLAGFVAATLYRGIHYINIPTTLLSQMDSSIGGKTGLDFANRKNIIGAFKQPLRVLIDPKTLNTLSKEEYSNGMAELIKHAIIGNKKLLDMLTLGLEVNDLIIEESLKVKKALVEIDEYDQGERMKLNFGHTFGHIIELEKGYKHGIAVGLGMLMALNFGIDLAITDKDCYDSVEAIMKKYDLPVDKYDYHTYLNKVMYDKKNLAGVINFILISKLGKAIIYPVKEEVLGR